MKKIFSLITTLIAFIAFIIPLQTYALEPTAPDPNYGYNLNWYKDTKGKTYIYGTIPQESEALNFAYSTKAGNIYTFTAASKVSAGYYLLEVDKTNPNLSTLKRGVTSGNTSVLKTGVPLAGTASFNNLTSSPQVPDNTTTGANPTTPGGTGTTIKNQAVPAANLSFSFNTMFGGSCDTYECWIQKVWMWATAIMLPLSIIVLIIAGALYATSAGNPDKIGIAKKLIIGVLSGLALIVIARILLVNFVGLDSSIWNI